MEQEVLNKFRDLQNQIDDISQFKNPQSIEARLENMNIQIEDVSKIMGEISLKLQTLDFDRKFIEEFQDDELKRLYQESGVKIQEVIDFIARMKLPSGGSNDYAYRLVNGDVKDPVLRSLIGKFLRYHGLKNKTI